MATYIFKNAFVSIAGVDLSDHKVTVTIDTGIEAQDKTAMGMNTRQSKGGLKTWSMSFESHQDFASGKIDQTIAGLTDNEAALIVRPDAGSVSTTNPQWAGTGLLTSYNPISGTVGDLAVASMTFEAAGDLTRTTA